MKKIVSFLLVLSVCMSIPGGVFAQKVAPSCPFKKDFDDCVAANKNGTTRAVSLNNQIICIESQDEYQIMFQLVLDYRMREKDAPAAIDSQVYKYLKSLQKYKDYFFGKDYQEPFTKAVDEIESVFGKYGEFGKKYTDACSATALNGVLLQTLQCFEDQQVPISDSLDAFLWETTCQNLITTKLEIYRQVAYDILQLNKWQVKKDEDKLYMQQERWSYDKLLEIMMINLWYLERIWKKWPSKTKSAQQK